MWDVWQTRLGGDEVLERHGMDAMLVLFDACWRPDLEDASPIPGVHNSASVQCPTHDVSKCLSKIGGTTLFFIQSDR